MVEVEPGFRDGERGSQLGEGVGHRAEGSPGRAEGPPSGEPVLHNGGGAGHGVGRRAGAGRRLRHDTVLRLLGDDPARLESGLVVLDKRLPLDDDVVVDLLARDPLGYPVAVLLCDDDPTGVLGRMAAVVAALERSRHLVGRMFGSQGLDPTLRPRFALLSSRFPDQMPALLALLGTVEVRALEYRIVEDGDGGQLLDLDPFFRSLPKAQRTAGAPEPVASRPAPETATGGDWEGEQSPPTAEELELVDGVDAETDAKRLFLRARGSIRSLSQKIEEEIEAGNASYACDGEPLASLVLEQKGLRVVVGQDAGGAVVTDPQGLDAALNAVFGLYFQLVRA